jgi:ribose-phosphate pyrophosphokinase
VNEQDTTVVPFPSSINDDSAATAKTVSVSVAAEQPKQAAESVLTPVASAAGTKVSTEKKRSSRLSEDKRFKIFSGSANRPLAEEIGKFLGVPVGETRLQRFSDGETHFQLIENVRGADVFLIQPTCRPVDQNLVELLIMMDALKRASAGRITVVVPYYGYARQDRKDRPRVAITSKLVADLLATAGANRALFVDLHAAQIQGFFNIPVDHLFASPVLVGYFRALSLPNLTVVSPDAGGVERARFFAQRLEVPLAIVDKRRTDINVTEVMNVIGDVHGRTCLILDDIVDTAGTLVKTAEALLDQGAEKVYACASHAVLSGPAVERINASHLEQLVVTNTIPLSEAAQQVSKIKVLSIAGLLGRAIESIHMETSVSTLFN